MNFLFVIPARGGSKGIPKKNIKHLRNKPLIQYSLEVAMQLTEIEHVCVSTDDDEIIDTLKSLDYKVPFKRPSHLATDDANTRDVLLHALDYYSDRGKHYDAIVLLQPTSPFRTSNQVKAAIQSFTTGIDMVVSVKETSANPYYNLFEENNNGYLEVSKKGAFTRRQDCPKVYEFNGAIYVIDVESLKQKPISEFTRIVKYEMSEETSIDLDTPFDWMIAEHLAGHIENNSAY